MQWLMDTLFSNSAYNVINNICALCALGPKYPQKRQKKFFRAYARTNLIVWPTFGEAHATPLLLPDGSWHPKLYQYQFQDQNKIFSTTNSSVRQFQAKLLIQRSRCNSRIIYQSRARYSCRFRLNRNNWKRERQHTLAYAKAVRNKHGRK